MAVEVVPTYRDEEGKTSPLVFEGADKWHIDPQMQLHVRDNQEGNLGSFAQGCWTSVRKIDQASDRGSKSGS